MTPERMQEHRETNAGPVEGPPGDPAGSTADESQETAALGASVSSSARDVLARCEEIDDAGTDEPWHAYDDELWAGDPIPEGETREIQDDGWLLYNDKRHENYRLTALARNTFPATLELVRAVLAAGKHQHCLAESDEAALGNPGECEVCRLLAALQAWLKVAEDHTG